VKFLGLNLFNNRGSDASELEGKVLSKKSSEGSLTDKTENMSQEDAASERGSRRVLHVPSEAEMLDLKRLLWANDGVNQLKEYIQLPAFSGSLEKMSVIERAAQEIEQLIANGYITAENIQSFEIGHWVLLAFSPIFQNALKQGEISAKKLQTLESSQCFLLRRIVSQMARAGRDIPVSELLKLTNRQCLLLQSDVKLQSMTNSGKFSIDDLAKLTDDQCVLLESSNGLQHMVSSGKVLINELSKLTNSQCVLVRILVENDDFELLEKLSFENIARLEDWQCSLIGMGLLDQLDEGSCAIKDIISLKDAEEVKSFVERYAPEHLLQTYIEAIARTQESPEILSQVTEAPFSQIYDSPVIGTLLNNENLSVGEVLGLLRTNKELSEEECEELPNVLNRLEAVANKVNREHFFGDFLTRHPLETILELDEEKIEELALRLSDSQQAEAIVPPAGVPAVEVACEVRCLPIFSFWRAAQDPAVQAVDAALPSATGR